MPSHQQRLFEKVQLDGISVETLDDSDLLALVVSKGTATERAKALTLIKTLLAEHGGLNGVVSTDAGEMLQYGFDDELAIRLRALLELAHRLTRPAQRRYQIRSADDAVLLVGPDMRYLDHEEMRVLVLNTKNHVVANIRLYQGTVNSSVIRSAEVFRPAITRNCPHVIVLHNHPSGDSAPSPEDIDITRQLVEAAKLLDIELLDHIIIGNPRDTSLKEKLGW